MMGREFQSRQVIQIWQKANRMRLPENKMKELHKDLSRIDAMYHKLKKEVTKDRPDNEIRSKDDVQMRVDMQLKEVLKKYAMTGAGLPNEKTKLPVSKDMPFEDRKIAQLWVKAQKSKLFSEQELLDLKEELSNHQEKQKEFNSLMEEIHGEDGSKSNSAKRFENKNPEEIRNIRIKEMELKMKHREISRDFERISLKTIPEEERGPFADRRVITLWQEAKKQDFSADDLEAIMEELKGFEEKVMEHDRAHQESLHAEIKERTFAKNPADKVQNTRQKTLYSRAKELGMGIHDTMKNLRHRISQGGKWNTEL